MKRKKKEKKKAFIIVSLIIVVLLLIVMSFNFNRKITPVERVLKDISMGIEKVIMYPFTSLNKEKGKTQSESYLIQKSVNSSLEKEIEELKATLELNNTLTEYKPINATILSRNKSYWFNTLMVDKGSSDKIEEEMAVITKDGLIGKVAKVYDNSCEVKLLTSDDINFKVSVSIKTNGMEQYAILNGYDPDKKLLKVTGIDKATIINEGDEVLTSGLGGVFPAGIYVGVVEKQESDKYDLSKTLYIKTKQDFDSIHYVTILGRKE